MKWQALSTSASGVGIEGFWFQQGYDARSAFWRSSQEQKDLRARLELCVTARELNLLTHLQKGKANSNFCWDTDQMSHSFFFLFKMTSGALGLVQECLGEKIAVIEIYIYI